MIEGIPPVVTRIQNLFIEPASLGRDPITSRTLNRYLCYFRRYGFDPRLSVDRMRQGFAEDYHATVA